MQVRGVVHLGSLALERAVTLAACNRPCLVISQLCFCPFSLSIIRSQFLLLHLRCLAAQSWRPALDRFGPQFVALRSLDFREVIL